MRSNTIRSSMLDVTHSGGEDGPSPEVLDHSLISGSITVSGPLLPSEVRDILKRLWENEGPLCSYICDIQHQKNNISGNIRGYSMFFLENILVPPIKFRPPAKGGDSVMEHPHTLLLGKVLQENNALGNAHMNNSEHPMIIRCWMDLHQSINVLFDSKNASSQSKKDGLCGICQGLEKKEGLFRNKMMGKGVNCVCLSVISPDPFLRVNEIGIPQWFALKMVYAEPTLHKPSIMAHVVRVLKGERTLRMHYANCSSYNADFDGDEINVHFPQEEISRAEAYNIVNANEQYIVPTKGDTVRCLIQDHIVAAVLLPLKNTFLTRSEFTQLLYGSGVFAAGPGSHTCDHCRTVSVIDSEGLVDSVFPAVWKPELLWTGKQVITALLNHITRGRAPCTVKNQGKVPKNYFASASYKNGEEDLDHNAEHDLLIWKNELVRGVVDKAQFGKFGLVHTVQELYGSNSAVSWVHL